MSPRVKPTILTVTYCLLKEIESSAASIGWTRANFDQCGHQNVSFRGPHGEEVGEVSGGPCGL